LEDFVEEDQGPPSKISNIGYFSVKFYIERINMNGIHQQIDYPQESSDQEDKNLFEFNKCQDKSA
jgi:aspartate oxidase